MRILNGKYNVDTLMPKQNGHQFTGIFPYIFIKENFCILIPISLKFVPEDPTRNKSVLFQAMALLQKGDRPLTDPMLTQIYNATWCQWA